MKLQSGGCVVQCIFVAEHQQTGDCQPLLTRCTILSQSAEFAQKHLGVFVEPHMIRIAGRKSIPVLPNRLGIKIGDSKV